MDKYLQPVFGSIFDMLSSPLFLDTWLQNGHSYGLVWTDSFREGSVIRLPYMVVHVHSADVHIEVISQLCGEELI